MSRLYFIIDRDGFIHLISAEKLHKKIMEQSKESNYNFIAPVTDLVRVCNKKSFPKEYAIDIKVAILNCFSEILKKYNHRHILESDLESVYKLYNSLFSITDERVINARYNFLKIYLIYSVYDYRNKILYKEDFYLECLTEWQKKKFVELSKLEEISFDNLKFSLVLDFEKFCVQKFLKKIFNYEKYKEKPKAKIYVSRNKNTL